MTRNNEKSGALTPEKTAAVTADNINEYHPKTVEAVALGSSVIVDVAADYKGSHWLAEWREMAELEARENDLEASVKYDERAGLVRVHFEYGPERPHFG